MKLKVVYFCLILCLSCSHKKPTPFVLQTTGLKEVYAHPHALNSEELPSHVKRLVIIGTNDFHGNLQINLEKTKEAEGKTSLMIPIGGAPLIAGYFNILRKKYPDELVLLDGGDLYQGTMISNLFKGEPVVKFYNELRYTALTIGNHEFDYGPEHLERTIAKPSEDRFGSIKKNIKNSKAPFVNSNIIDLKSGTQPNWPGLESVLLKTINGVKVGILGAATTETIFKTLKDNVRGLYFENLAKVSLQYSEKLRAKGAQVVILVTHAGTTCGFDLAKSFNAPLELVNFNPEDPNICDKNDELGRVLNQLPPGTLDAVVAGHTHAKIANFINGIPVIESFYYGKYLGRMELYYDQKEKKVLTEKTKIYQPTKFCHKFFRESMDCNPFDHTINHDDQVDATFLGEVVTADPAIEKLLSPYATKIQQRSEKIIAHLEETLSFARLEESPLGDLTADAIRYVLKTDVAITNSGGIRTSLESGDVTYGTVFKAMPFDNFLMILKATGKQLKNLIRIGTSGYSTGIACLSGVKVTINPSKSSDGEDDLNHDGKKEDWERNRLVSVVLEDGSELIDDKIYTVGTQSFLGDMGGDFYGFVTDQITSENKDIIYTETYRDAVVHYLEELTKKQKILNTKAKPYLSADQKRIISK